MVLCSFAGGAITKAEAINMLLRIGNAEERNTAYNFIRNCLGTAEKMIANYPREPGDREPFFSREELEEIIKTRKTYYK